MCWINCSRGPWFGADLHATRGNDKGAAEATVLERQSRMLIQGADPIDRLAVRARPGDWLAVDGHDEAAA